jgi:transcriptional regulator with XRE-family HTH domain
MPSFKKLLQEFGASESTPNETVRLFRKGLGMTLKEVEDVTGIRESHLSAIENGKIEMTQHYAEVFAATFGLHPTAFLYPNGEFKKSKELEAIEQRAKKYITRARPMVQEKTKKRAI